MIAISLYFTLLKQFLHWSKFMYFTVSVHEEGAKENIWT
jgi:hypothetical protein